ncbi:MAG: hypothetical protein O3C63_01955 [Cyanobacteria bacterium]|nr:hypothetical protein [Cyanobacteriota bacterium]MDA1021054.1 hypothetical protein [Cyanobacteriota bacterium]
MSIATPAFAAAGTRNEITGKKVGWHAVAGLLPPFRFWSGYDALYNRDGGYWEGKI